MSSVVVPILRPTRREMLALLLIVLVFLCINLLTAARYPIVWIDEVMFTDPAINLLSGNGFVTTMWPQLDKSQLFAGYPPLYPATLSGWLWLTGVNPVSVRSLNYILMITCCLLIWYTVYRQGWIKSGPNRLLLILLVLCGYGIAMGYRSGRPDTLMLLLACAALAAGTINHPAKRRWSLALLCILFPWAGLQMLPFVFCASTAALFILRKKFWWEYVAINLGAAVGAVGLVGFYVSQDVLNAFIASVRGESAVGFFGNLMQGRFDHENKIPKDLSLTMITLGIVSVTIYAHQKNRIQEFKPLVWALLYAFAMSVILIVAGKFPTYYSWMIYLPLCIAFVSVIPALKEPNSLRRGVYCVAGLAVTVGLPTQLALAFYDWGDRDPVHVAEYVAKNVKDTDVVFTDYGAYYEVKKRARMVYGIHYLKRLTEAEKREMSLLILAPDKSARYQAIAGGDWIPSDEPIALSKATFMEAILGKAVGFGMFDLKYRLSAYRRVDQTRPPE